MERVLILGAGPQARLIPDVIAACGNLELLGFVDVADERHFLRGDALAFPVYDGAQFPDELRRQLGDFAVVIGNDYMTLRRRLIAQVRETGLSLVNIVHPAAIVSPSARLGRGVLVRAGVIIGPGASIADHVILNNAVTVDHDTVIEENVIIGPGANIAGGVVVKRDTMIGIGANCVHAITIGSNCLIGAGSVVTRDVPDNVIAAGVPARVIRTRE